MKRSNPCAVALSHIIEQCELTDAGQWNDAKTLKAYIVKIAVSALKAKGLKPADISTDLSVIDLSVS